MQLALYEKYDLRLPRYTSYPTAPHFHDAINGKVFANWLGELNPLQPLSLYLHVPYCEEMCWFCGCNTKITKHYKPVGTYVAALLTEIKNTLGKLDPTHRFTVSHIHFGGGSPTILKADDLRTIMGAIRKKVDILPTAEVAIEMDPRTANDDLMDAMIECGFNRASIGIQDFNADVQRAVNRVQSYDLVRDVISGLRHRGIRGINVDLMYGLPNQTVQSIRQTVDQTATLCPDRLSVFGYAHVPWMKKHQNLIPAETLPDTQDRWAQYEEIQNRLAYHRYVAIGLDHFAHQADPMATALYNGKLHRNFQGYTTDRAEALIGFGPSAISSLPQGYAQNDPALARWQRAVEGGDCAVEKGVAVSNEDRLRRDIINELMCNLSVDVAKICATHGTSADRFAPELNRIRAMTNDNIVEVNSTHIKLTNTGRPLVRAVCAVFDTYLNHAHGRHSQAV
ncbi:oxygen-independent coproporphyrinogen III oxidase [Thalassospira lucentensis]|uniref:Coproporphyrinogen-III oxidase n=1 Tax=Thalassospira lucentensis TaxID=168935 RepID=A0A358HZQ3_9PROT|nr:oxygen-independent coproporphyrinogen III oxidase [Thalassospira lucentensis]HBV00661.1 oxygen-independent coproporphyrinogen III oxidase [Thalassospira lucentensis]HCW65789.1 oxygen-independent coproporphyrinogen III oxidase [Thalassospira lucentensis]